MVLDSESFNKHSETYPLIDEILKPIVKKRKSKRRCLTEISISLSKTWNCSAGYATKFVYQLENGAYWSRARNIRSESISEVFNLPVIDALRLGFKDYLSSMKYKEKDIERFAKRIDNILGLEEKVKSRSESLIRDYTI